MLVLSRKFGEKIQIGGGITITVVQISGDKVRIGIDAPTEVPVHRSEVWDAIVAERARAKTRAERARLDETKPDSPGLDKELPESKSGYIVLD